MVGDVVSDDTKVVLVGLPDEFYEIILCPVMRVDLVEICDMVTVVRGGLIERGDPESGDSKVLEIGDFFDNAFECPSEEPWLVPVFCRGESCEPVDEDVVDGPLSHPVKCTHQECIASLFLYRSAD